MRKRLSKWVHVLYLIVLGLGIALYFNCIFAYSSTAGTLQSKPALTHEELIQKVEHDLADLPSQKPIERSQIESSKPSALPTNTDVKPTEAPKMYVDLTEEEIRDFATLVYLEGGAESYECQLAIASVVVNRMTSTGKSLDEVMYQKNQFSPSHLIESREPSESTLKAVKEVITNGPSVPKSVTFFRADYYHKFNLEIVVPYTAIDHTYFSKDIRLE